MAINNNDVDLQNPYPVIGEFLRKGAYGMGRLAKEAINAPMPQFSPEGGYIGEEPFAPTVYKTQKPVSPTQRTYTPEQLAVIEADRKISQGNTPISPRGTIALPNKPVAAEEKPSNWWEQGGWKISGKGGITPQGETPTAVIIRKGAGEGGSDLLEARGIPELMNPQKQFEQTLLDTAAKAQRKGWIDTAARIAEAGLQNVRKGEELGLKGREIDEVKSLRNEASLAGTQERAATNFRNWLTTMGTNPMTKEVNPAAGIFKMIYNDMKVPQGLSPEDKAGAEGMVNPMKQDIDDLISKTETNLGKKLTEPQKKAVMLRYGQRHGYMLDENK